MDEDVTIQDLPSPVRDGTYVDVIQCEVSHTLNSLLRRINQLISLANGETLFTTIRMIFNFLYSAGRCPTIEQFLHQGLSGNDAITVGPVMLSVDGTRTLNCNSAFAAGTSQMRGFRQRGLKLGEMLVKSKLQRAFVRITGVFISHYFAWEKEFPLEFRSANESRENSRDAGKFGINYTNDPDVFETAWSTGIATEVWIFQWSINNDKCPLNALRKNQLAKRENDDAWDLFHDRVTQDMQSMERAQKDAQAAGQDGLNVGGSKGHDKDA